MGVPAATFTTTWAVTANLDISSSEASPMLLPTRSRKMSDSLNGWFRLLRPTNIVPTCPIPDNDLTSTFLPVFFPSALPLNWAHFEICCGGLDWDYRPIRQHQRVELDAHVTRAVRFLNVPNRLSSRGNNDFTVPLVVVLDHCQNGRSHRRTGRRFQACAKACPGGKPETNISCGAVESFSILGERRRRRNISHVNEG